MNEIEKFIIAAEIKDIQAFLHSRSPLQAELRYIFCALHVKTHSFEEIATMIEKKRCSLYHATRMHANFYDIYEHYRIKYHRIEQTYTKQLNLF